MFSLYIIYMSTFVQKFVCRQVMHLSADKFVQDELVDRLNSINERLNTLRVENEEVKHGWILYSYLICYATSAQK